MPQLFLPMIPSGATAISDTVSVVRENGRWEYFLGLYPIFQHHESETRLFKLITSQLINSGACRHRDIMKTFGRRYSHLPKIRCLDKAASNNMNERQRHGKDSSLQMQIRLQQQALCVSS